jgi:hypothetical protein
VMDLQHVAREIAIDTPLALGAMPWQWDISTENQSYGAFRNPTDAMVFSQTTPEGGQPSPWKVEAGAAGDLRVVETSVDAGPPPASRTLMARTGHLQSATQAVAFAIDQLRSAMGTYSVSLDGRGQATYAFAPAGPSTNHVLVVYQHFVSTPVAIGAATSPAAMVQPLAVQVQP